MARRHLLAPAAAGFLAATATPAATPAASGPAHYDVSMRMQDGDRPPPIRAC